MHRNSILLSLAALAAFTVAGVLYTRHDASAVGPATSTIVGINPGVEPYEVTLLPDSGTQPAYGIFVSEACRLTLHVGDTWPSAATVCK